MMEFTDKVFFITGAAQGLGKAYMDVVLEKGAKVYFSDVNEALGKEILAETAAKFGKDRVSFKAFDVTDGAAFEGAFKEAVSQFQQVDVLVNNAGIMNEGIWEKMIQINVTALIHGSKLASEHMRKDKGGKGGKIINISSIAGLIDPYFLPIYAATKHAVRVFTSSMALQPNIEAQGIDYAVLCPNAAATDLIFKLDDSKIDYKDDVMERLEKTAMPIESVVAAFLELLQLKKMNGAMLLVESTGTKFVKMVKQDAPHPDEPPKDSDQASQ